MDYWARHLAVATLGLGLAITSRAHAQAGPSYSIGASAGLAVPVSDLSNTVDAGYTVGLSLGMHQPLVPLSFRAEGTYTEFGWSGANDIKHKIYGLSIDALYNLGTPSSNGGLYFTGGAGYFGSKDTGNIFAGNENTEWNAGINLGLGYYLPLSGFAVTFEGRWRNIFSNPNQAMFPITVGISF